MKRLFAGILALLALPAIAGPTIKVEVNNDGTVDTVYRAGNKPISGGSCPTGWTCAVKGDATLDEDEVSSSSFTLTVSGTNDEGNIGYIYKTESSDSDMQIEARIPASWTGHLENFTGFGVGFTEGTGDSAYTSQCFWPNVGRVRLKADAGGAGETETAEPAGPVLPRYVALTYDDSETDMRCWASNDGSAWTEVASTSKSLTFPVLYYVYGTSHDAGATTTATLTGIAYTTTIDIYTPTAGGGGEAPVWTPISNQSWTQDVAVSLDVSANCTDAQAVTFSAVSGLSGRGLSISSGGVISGTPNSTAAADSPFNVTIRCSDGTNTSDESFTANVAPVPGDNFNVSTGTSTFNCSSQGVGPGDTVTLLGTSRGPIKFVDCNDGTSSNPITIRNDTTESGPLVISGTGAIIFEMQSTDGVVIDGTGKWSGATSANCSGLSAATWPTQGSTHNCGIVIRPSSGSTDYFMRFRERRRNFTVKGVHLDGQNVSAGLGIGISCNDGTYSQSAHPGEWVENILFEDIYAEDVPNEAWYCGANKNQNGGDVLRGRNLEVRYNYAEDCGGECFNFKSWHAGYRLFHHNHADGCVLNSSSGTDNCVNFSTGSVTEMYNNRVHGSPDICMAVLANEIPGARGEQTPHIYNNVIYDCPTGIDIGGGGGASDADIDYLIEFNTVIASLTNVNSRSNAEAGTIRQNILACSDASCTPISAGNGITTSANSSGSEASMDFDNAASDDYHIGTSSPAYNTGSGCPAEDHDDLTRSGTCDRGAYTE